VKAALVGADRALTVTDIERPVPAVGEVLIDACARPGRTRRPTRSRDCSAASARRWSSTRPGTRAARRSRCGCCPPPCDRIITKVAPLDSAPAIVAELHGGATDHVKVLLTP
jgi:hypothetical protein